MPPGFSDGWDDLPAPQQASLVAYHQTVLHDEHESMSKSMASMFGGKKKR